MSVIVAAIGCGIVGLVVGWSGISGFLIPILLVNYCGLTTAQSLMLGFLCFTIDGFVGAFNYARQKYINKKTAGFLSIGSIVGSLMGAGIAGLLAVETVKTILYGVVLFSGTLIIVRDLFEKEKENFRESLPVPLLLIIGFATALICALAGAGGPIIVIPILVALGIAPKEAVGTALLNCIFVSVPAFIVYTSRVDVTAFLPVVIIIAVVHTVGLVIGSATANRVPVVLLKRFIAVFSVGFSIYTLFLM